MDTAHVPLQDDVVAEETTAQHARGFPIQVFVIQFVQFQSVFGLESLRAAAAPRRIRRTMEMFDVTFESKTRRQTFSAIVAREPSPAVARPRNRTGRPRENSILENFVELVARDIWKSLVPLHVQFEVVAIAKCLVALGTHEILGSVKLVAVLQLFYWSERNPTTVAPAALHAPSRDGH